MRRANAVDRDNAAKIIAALLDAIDYGRLDASSQVVAGLTGALVALDAQGVYSNRTFTVHSSGDDE